MKNIAAVWLPMADARADAVKVELSGCINFIYWSVAAIRIAHKGHIGLAIRQQQFIHFIQCSRRQTTSSHSASAAASSECKRTVLHMGMKGERMTHTEIYAQTPENNNFLLLLGLHLRLVFPTRSPILNCPDFYLLFIHCRIMCAKEQRRNR